MAGVYIHIPFCRQACHYCDFHFSTSAGGKQAMVQAIIKELHLRKDYLGGEEVSTIYFGGGTPSVLTAEEQNSIIETTKKLFPVEDNAEITLEANPDDLDADYIQSLRQTPVNRLSIGIQSFDDALLHWMNRTHTAAQAITAVENAFKAGFENITIDLIYGIPGLSVEEWKRNLEQAFALPVQHLSAYCLTVEQKTALAHFVNKGKVKMPEDEVSLSQFDLLMNEAEKNNFVQYEISNFGCEGFFSRHNTSYWKGIKYLGVGPSAHSYDHISRQWNVRNNALYIKAVNEGVGFFEREELTKSDQYNEYIMTSLRTLWGVNKKTIKERFGAEFFSGFLQSAEEGLRNETLQEKGDTVTLTQKGKFLADSITSALFIFKPEMKEQ